MMEARPAATASPATIVVGVLQPLRVVGGERREDEHADHRDRELQGRGGQEDVHDRGDDQADHAHDQERAPAGQIPLRRVAVEAQARANEAAVMKNVRAMLSPVKTMKMDDSERPITAA